MSLRNRPIRIVVEPSDFDLLNHGDMAMQYLAIDRLSQLWPDSTISVLTDVPERLREFCPAATPLCADGRSLWLDKDFLPGKLKRLIPQHLHESIRHRAPRLVTLSWRVKLRRHATMRADLARYTRALDEAELVLVSGMGGIADGMSYFTDRLLEALNLALSKKGRPVVMVGQGIGPLDNPELRARAAAILPRLDLIAIREKRATLPLLLALGVPADRIILTGDDSLEMAQAHRPDGLGTGIGVSLRVSDYSEVGSDTVDALRQVLAALSKSLAADLVALPVSRVPGEADMETIRHLMPDSKAELERGLQTCTPQELVRQVQRCRVVVAGSYHAAVFALANGIPAVGLAKSSYYVDKFLGLSDIFGVGCEVVVLDRADYAEAVQEAALRLWESAPNIRSAILSRAEAQIEASHAAYRRIYELVMAQC